MCAVRTSPREVVLVLVVVGALAPTLAAVEPDHPIITEVFSNPLGNNDGPLGRDPANLHQEYIEIYLPDRPELDVINLTFYEVEGDRTSSGYALVNYRIDLPTFDLDPSNGLTGLARPSSGVVVLGWVDYENSDAGTCTNMSSCSVFAQDCADFTECVPVPPSALWGMPGTRKGLVNGGITSAADYVFIAINGDQFSGTTNFPSPSIPGGISWIHMPDEARSGTIQNGSAAYLLVDRDDPGYVELYDDKDTAHVPPILNAYPDLAGGTRLETSSFLDGLAGNDDSAFEVLLQPYPEGDSIDLADIRPPMDAAVLALTDEQVACSCVYCCLIPQIASNGENGYARAFIDVAKTTEDGVPGNDDPVVDAQDAYMTISSGGPFYPRPGIVTETTSPPELAVAGAGIDFCDMLAATTGEWAVTAANVGGNFAIQVTATPGASSDPTSAIFAPGVPATVSTGQTLVFPGIVSQISATATHDTIVTASVDVEAVNVNPGVDPDVENASWSTSATVRVLNPSTGQDASGQPHEATVFMAIQPVPNDPGVLNEFLATDLGQFLAAQPDITALETLGNGAALINPATNIASHLVVRPMIKGMPEDLEQCTQWLPRPCCAQPPGFAQTVAASAENVVNQATYEGSIGVCNVDTVIKGIRVNVPDTLTFGGTFSPSEPIHFVDPVGGVGEPNSGLTDVTTTRGFEIALIDTAVRTNGSLESGATDDFGIVIEVAEVEVGSSFAPGDYVFLSFTGGYEGTDVDTLNVPPGDNVAIIILLDLDNLHDVLDIRSINSLYIIDAGQIDQGGEIEIIEGFSLPAIPGGCSGNPECDDGDPCNGEETCVSAECQGGTAPNCDDTNECTNDFCNAAHPDADPVTGCVNDPTSGAACDDGEFCTVDATCTSGVCGQGVARDCGDGIVCTTDTCNETNNMCQHSLSPGNCLIELACYADEEVDPGDDCAACDSSVNPFGWTELPDGTTCDDQSDCTESDQCATGVCSGSPIPGCECTLNQDCGDQDPCTVDVCDPVDPESGLDGCVHTYRPRPYGDVSPFGSIVPPCPADPQGELGDGFANMLDVFCAFNAFNEGAPYTQCPCGDVSPCGGDSFVNMLDVFAIFSAFNGSSACSAPCP